MAVRCTLTEIGQVDYMIAAMRHQIHLNCCYYIFCHQTTLTAIFLRYFWFHIFFTLDFWGHTLFLQLGCFCIDITSFYNRIFTKLTYGQLWCFFLCLFLYYRSDTLLWNRCWIQNWRVLVSFCYIILLHSAFTYTLALFHFVLELTQGDLIIYLKPLQKDFYVVELCTGWLIPGWLWTLYCMTFDSDNL